MEVGLSDTSASLKLGGSGMGTPAKVPRSCGAGIAGPWQQLGQKNSAQGCGAVARNSFIFFMKTVVVYWPLS